MNRPAKQRHTSKWAVAKEDPAVDTHLKGLESFGGQESMAGGMQGMQRIMPQPLFDKQIRFITLHFLFVVSVVCGPVRLLVDSELLGGLLSSLFPTVSGPVLLPLPIIWSSASRVSYIYISLR